jgi:hypothetical protein
VHGDSCWMTHPVMFCGYFIDTGISLLACEMAAGL